MKLLKIICVLSLVFFTFSGAFAQPAEHEIIYKIVQHPDRLLSAEFNVLGTSHIFSVSLESKKSIFDLQQMFKQNANLNLISVEYIFPVTWNLMLSNKESSKLDFVKFNEIARLDWQHHPDHPVKIILNKATVSVIIAQNTPSQATANLETAGNAGLQLTSTSRQGNLQLNTFTYKLKAVEYALPSDFNEPETDFIKDLKTFATIKDGYSADKDAEYTLELHIEDFPAIFETLAKNNMTLAFMEFFTLDSKNCEIKIRVVNGGSEQSRKIAFLKHFVREQPLPMAKNGYNSETPVVTGFATTMKDKFTVLGFSPKSSLIFSQLMPVIQYTPGLKHPFFSRGTNKMTDYGKVMHFRIDCDW